MKFVETYAELLSYKPVKLRSRLRNSALDLASSFFPSPGQADSLLRRNRVQFIYIHHIFRDEEEKLRALLEKLSIHHRFISYSSAVEKILSNTIDQPYICISSDDGLKNNLRAGAILEEYGISACFFICPSMIGEKDPDKISHFTMSRLHFPPVEFLNWSEVEELRMQGHEIGGHTMTHANLAECNQKNLEFEIAACHEELKQHIDGAFHFAYPYGRFFHFSADARRMVFDAGFKSCASAERGCHISSEHNPPSREQLLIRRDHVILSWPWKHLRYFLAMNSKRAEVKGNAFPSYAGDHTNK